MAELSNLLGEDQYLQQQDIQVERSSFLAQHYASKAVNFRNSYNPRDPFGNRLSHYWQQGDTYKGVIWKKMKDTVFKALNPDTYSKKSVIELKEKLVKYQEEVIATIIIIGIPVFMILPILRPRIVKAKREFLFQYYKQSQILAKKLETTNAKIPVEEVEEIIRKAEDRANYNTK